jgi:hypothetical protein
MTQTTEQMALDFVSAIETSSDKTVLIQDFISQLNKVLEDSSLTKEERIKKYTDERVQALIIKNRQKEEQAEQIELINATFRVVLEDLLNKETSDVIVNELDKCRKSKNGFMSIMSLYCLPQFRENEVNRNLLRCISAIYRLKMKNGMSSSEQRNLKSTIKWASKCDHCGPVADELMNRLNLQGITV